MEKTSFSLLKYSGKRVSLYSERVHIIKIMQFQEAHDSFLNWLEVIKNKSPRTIEQYNRHLTKFSEYLEDKNIDSFTYKVGDITLKIAE